MEKYGVQTLQEQYWLVLLLSENSHILTNFLTQSLKMSFFSVFLSNSEPKNDASDIPNIYLGCTYREIVIRYIKNYPMSPSSRTVPRLYSVCVCFGKICVRA